MDGTIITKRGMQLLVKLMATKGVLTFTRVAIGTGSIPNGYDPASMIELVQYKMDGVISKCSAGEDVARITMQVSSVGIETGFIMTEMGVFASDPDIGEILYAYLDMKEDPQYIYAEGGETQKFVETTLEVAIEHATKVSTYINPSSLITKEDFDAEIEKIIIPEFDDSGEVTGITNFPAFLEKIKSKMNIFEFFKNLKAGLQFVLHTGQIVNNCVSDNPELPLSAAQGKILMDLINQTNGNLKSYKSYKFSDSEYNGTTITNMIEHYWSNISNQTYGMASFLNSSNAFSGTYYKHDNNNGFIIFSGQSPSYKTQKGVIMNGNWTWTSLITNTDLQTEQYMIPQPTPGNIFKAFDVWGCRVYKSGKIVTLRLNCACEMPASSNEHILFNLPEKYKPADDNIIINYITQKGINMMISIKNNGEFRLFNNNQTVPKNDWLLRQCITYVADN